LQKDLELLRDGSTEVSAPAARAGSTLLVVPNMRFHRSMKDSTLEYLIAVKTAELYAAEDLLRPKPVAWATLAPMRPDEWVQRLAEVKLLHDYAGRLTASFEALVRDAHVPRHPYAAKNISTTR
jgi:hypothetical protein